MANFYDEYRDMVTELSVDLSRAEAGIKRTVRSQLKKMEKELVQQIKNVDPTSVSGQFQQVRLEKLLKQTQETIRTTYSNIYNSVKTDTVSLMNMTADTTLANINTAIGAPLATTAVPPATIRALATNGLIDGAKSSEWWRAQGSTFNSRFKTEMRAAIYNGESVGDMVRRLRGTFDPASRQFVGGIMSATTKQAEALVRTSVINLTNQAKLDVFDANDDVVDGIQWVSTLDSRTTQICASLDGLIWSLPNYDPVDHNYNWPGPTAHWNCRSTQVPALKPFKNIPKRKQKLLEGSRIGRDQYNNNIQFPPGTTYNDWFKKQTVARQKDILGPKKYQIWKENGLTPQQMVNFDNRPLTVRELEAKYGKPQAA